MAAKPWPYPRTKRALIQVVVITLVCLLGGGGFGLLQLQHYTKKALTIDDTARAQSALAGFASEAQVLSHEASNRHTFGTYQTHYFATLSDQTQSVGDYLHGHHGNSEKTERTSQALQHHAKKLQIALGAAKDEHDTNKLTRAAAAFAALQKTIEQTGTGQ